MSLFWPSSRSNINPFLAMHVLDKANSMEKNERDVYHLEIGQPGTGAPPSALSAVQRAVGQDVMGYTSAFGMPILREKMCEFYWQRYRAKIDPSAVAITNGSSAGFVLAFLAAFEPGARVGLAAPGYPAYRNILKSLGYEPILIKVDASTRFQPTVEMLEQYAPLDGFILASPSNPTGTMISPELFQQIYVWCETNGCRLISDEIYHGLTWGQCETSAANNDGHAIIVNSFSKYFSMTGWRVGWLILPEDLIEVVGNLAQNLFICAPAISQIAAEGALEDIGYLDNLRDGYRHKADALSKALEPMNLPEKIDTDGGFYSYLNVSGLTDNSLEFAAEVLEHTGVAIVPGLDFDPYNGHKYVRLSFAGSMETVEKGGKAFADWCQNIG